MLGRREFMNPLTVRELFLEAIRCLETEAAAIRRFEALGPGQQAPAAYYTSRRHYRDAANQLFGRLQSAAAKQV